MVLRLDPELPIVWRDPTTIQVGVDPAVAVIQGVTPGIERLVALLEAGVSESGYPMFAGTFGLSARQADRLLSTLEPCLLTAGAPAAAARGAAVVLGANPLAHAIARLLDTVGARTADPAQAELVVLVADHVISPVEHRGWLQRDIPHLPVVVGGAAITIGPLVEPGAGACLHCVSLHARDADAAWPAIAAQLATRARSASHPLRDATAAALVARLVDARLHHGASPDAGRVLRLTGDGGELSERVVVPHPECRCSAPPESDWAPAADRADPPPPTTASAFAVPA